MMKRSNLQIIVFAVCIFFCLPFLVAASEYPKLGSYYLDPYVPKSDYENLAKYDLLILDIDAPTARPDLVDFLRKKNPQIKLFAYVTSQSVAHIDTLSELEKVRAANYRQAEAHDWWLRDSSGKSITYSDVFWFIKCIDPSDAWNNYLSDTIKKEVGDNSVWDGVFLDVVLRDISWLNGGDIDVNHDGKKDSSLELNRYWQNQMDDLLGKVRAKVTKPVIANVNPIDIYEGKLNGALFEDFPTPWFGANSWSLTMNQYLYELPKKNQQPQFYVLNSTSGNTGNSALYREMRFGLTSTLLGDGYHTFDFGSNEHSQAWWYDEYAVSLGSPESQALNLLDKSSISAKPGLWRRDFENGIAITNSTGKEQSYVFYQEEFEKIKGVQDRAVNSGEKTNWIKIPAQDGRILLKINNSITDDSFNNGSFVRVFDVSGTQDRNGFFSYKDMYPGNTQILLTDIDADGALETLVNGQGTISVYKNGKKISSFMPYDGKFSGEISFAVSDLNGDATKEIITGAGAGGGPHVRVFSKDGKPLTGGFFAYDKNFRGGVSVAVMDLNGDATKEIITGAGAGGGPHVRVFSKDGKPLTGGFFAYDQSWRGGVSVAAGDVNGDGYREVITGAGKGNTPLVKIFDRNGRFLKEFLAYNKTDRNGILVMSDDIDSDLKDEILVSLIE